MIPPEVAVSLVIGIPIMLLGVFAWRHAPKSLYPLRFRAYAVTFLFMGGFLIAVNLLGVGR